MRPWFRNLSIARRVWFLVGFAASSLIALAVASLLVLRARVLDERQAKVRAAVEATYHVVAHFGDLAESGKMTRAEAQRAALDVVRSMRYEEDEYCWINDLHPTMLAHPVKPEMEGQDLTNLADADGKRFIWEAVQLVRSDPRGQGSVSYRWPRANSVAPVSKSSFVKLYAPWEWMVGSGIYVDDVDSVIAGQARPIVGAVGLVGLLLVGAGLLIGRSVKGSIGELCVEARRLEMAVRDGRLSERAIAVAVGTEFRGVIEGMNRTMDAIVQPVNLTAEYIERITKGDIPPRIADDYRGDFNAIKENLNALIEMLGRRSQDIDVLIEAALDGKLDVRADASGYQGGNARVIEGMNA
ncbi:MAG TPA: cache domain-containing protein, partial [Anaeromyxobacteraceae bacterium]|nr:cache domain-containing protein [Anaeromyxobacteraceae bacterium]